MRSMVRTTLVSLVIAGATAGLAPAAFAGADDGGTKGFWLEATPAAAAAPQASQNARYTAKYEPVAAVDQAASATKREADPPAFYHAMGTMSQP